MSKNYLTASFPYTMPTSPFVGFNKPQSLNEADLLRRATFFEQEAFPTKPIDNQENSDSNTDPFLSILPDKLNSAKEVVQDIGSDLEERCRLKYDALNKIDGDILKARNYLIKLEEAQLSSSILYGDRSRSALEGLIFNLYREKRMEETNAFRDGVFLKIHHRDARQQYWDAKREVQLLTEQKLGYLK